MARFKFILNIKYTQWLKKNLQGKLKQLHW